MLATQLASSGISAGEQLASGDASGVGLLALQTGLSVMRASPLCQTVGKLGTAARVGTGLVLGGFGAYRAYLSARSRFESGDYIGGTLDVLQGVADVMAGRRSCFTAEMLLLWQYGKKRADTIVADDLLWSRDEHDPDGPLVLKRVLSVMVRTAQIWHMGVSGQVLRTTGEHPFWVENRGEWVATQELRVGDVVRTDAGELLSVEGVETTAKWERVYNWEIEDYHTYYVSASEDGASVWAHNTYGTGKSRSGRRLTLKDRMRVLVNNGIPGAKRLLKSLNSNAPGARYQAKRAWNYYRSGWLDRIEHRVGPGKTFRIDLRLRNGQRIEAKSWRVWDSLPQKFRNNRLLDLKTQVNNYLQTRGSRLRLEFQFPIPNEVQNALQQLKGVFGNRLDWGVF
jgi:hypothetical protein